MTFNTVDFNILFPEFASVDDAVILLVANQGLVYINITQGKCFSQLWNLVTAHLLKLRDNAATGNGSSGAVASVSIGSESVSFTQANSKSETAFWFGLTPYGLEFLALNKRCSGAAKYVGGSNAIQAFR